MGKFELKLLDCTLRDGGYINDWKWGNGRAKDIVLSLIKAGVDIIEVGFLRDIEEFDPDITVCNTIDEMNRFLPADCKNVMFSAMAMRSNYDLNKLEPYSGKGVELIRVTAHDYDIKEGIEFATSVKKKGYKVSINPINIMGYSDSQILDIVQMVNEVRPYQFAIVDTFGSMKRRDLDRIVSLVDNNLEQEIGLALHLHENMSLSFFLAQSFIDKHLRRNISIDASLLGMGRTPGNLPIELIAEHLNECDDAKYDIDSMMDAIQDYIAPLKGQTQWGYTPAYFLSAKYNLHRNYAEHFLSKGDLTNRNINFLLSQIESQYATVFDSEYADTLYENFKNHFIDDFNTIEKLRMKMVGKTILVLAPGETLIRYKKDIVSFIENEKPCIISTNFIPQDICCDYAFFSNNKRISKLNKTTTKIIGTSNLESSEIDYLCNYQNLLCSEGNSILNSNSLFLLLQLLKKLNVTKVYMAGADGYIANGVNYYDSVLSSTVKRNNEYNVLIADAIRLCGIEIEFITPSLYNELFN